MRVEALNYFQRCYRGYLKIHAADPTQRDLVQCRKQIEDTAREIGHMGTKAKKENKDYVEAQSLFEKARDGYELCLGADHATTLTMVTALAVLYEEQDNLTEARKCYEQALAGTERTKGLTHFKTLNIVRCIGNLLQNVGLEEEAIEYYTRALAGAFTQNRMQHTKQSTTQ